MDDGGEQIARLEERITAHDRLNEERIHSLDRLIEQRAETLEGRLGALQDRYEAAHQDLVNRVDRLAELVSGLTGTSSGTLRVFMVAAVGISLLGLVVTVVHLIGS